MLFIVFKYFLTSAIIIIVSEIAKRSDKLGAVISSLPLVTIITMVWLYLEKQPDTKIKNHAYYTFWYVLPTLPMFLLFPYLYDKYGFTLSLIISCFITFICFIFVAFITKKFGIELL